MEVLKLNINGLIIDVSKEEVSKAIEIGELEIKQDFKVFSNEQFSELEKNIRNDEYAKTKEKASEIFNKEVKRQYGIEVEGKDTTRVVEGLRNKILEEARIEPTKQIEELRKDAETLRQNLQLKENEFNTFKNDVLSKDKQQRIENFIISKLPKEGTVLPAEKLVKMTSLDGYSFDFDEASNIVAFKNGQMIKNNTTLSPENIDKVLNDFISPYLKQSEGGLGGRSTSAKGGAGSLEDFNMEMESKGIQLHSQEYNREMGNRISNKTLKV